MTQYPPQPTGQPWDHAPAEPPLTGSEAKASRPWYKKKRFIIPLGLVALLAAIGMLGGGEDVPVAPSSPDTSEVAETTADADSSASASAEAEASAAAAEEAARAAEEAERVAAEQAAAEKAAEEAAEAAAAGTVAQQNALRSAENYLDYTAFSRSGLIDQLIYEGFTPEQAEYGVNQTGL